MSNPPPAATGMERGMLEAIRHWTGPRFRCEFLLEASLTGTQFEIHPAPTQPRIAPLREKVHPCKTSCMVHAWPCRTLELLNYLETRTRGNEAARPRDTHLHLISCAGESLLGRKFPLPSRCSTGEHI